MVAFQHVRFCLFFNRLAAFRALFRRQCFEKFNWAHHHFSSISFFVFGIISAVIKPSMMPQCRARAVAAKKVCFITTKHLSFCYNTVYTLKFVLYSPFCKKIKNSFQAGGKNSGSIFPCKMPGLSNRHTKKHLDNGGAEKVCFKDAKKQRDTLNGGAPPFFVFVWTFWRLPSRMPLF